MCLSESWLEGKGGPPRPRDQGTWEEQTKTVPAAMCKGVSVVLLAARGDPHTSTSPLMACPSPGACPTTAQLLPVRLFACSRDSHFQEKASSQSHEDPPLMGPLLGGPRGARALSNEKSQLKSFPPWGIHLCHFFFRCLLKCPSTSGSLPWHLVVQW